MVLLTIAKGWPGFESPLKNRLNLLPKMFPNFENMFLIETIGDIMFGMFLHFSVT